MGILNLKRHVPPQPGRSSVTIIARGNSFKGELEIRGKTHVDGSIQGLISAEDDISIGKNGLLKGRVKGKSIFVSGSLKGEVTCEHLFIEPGGEVHANVCCANMKIDQGGLFVGERTLPEHQTEVKLLSPKDSNEPSNSDEHEDIFSSIPQLITLKKDS